ncbi:MAG: amidohydrolase, partial [Dehalococcoidales bacterium]|nr:amidohydrolase [Dehalococcoidales bacterium]
MLIDFHTHIFPPRIKANRDSFSARDPLFRLLYSDPKARIITADELISSMDEHHVDISVVLNIDWSTPDLCHETNDYILEAISRFPNRLAGFC